MILGKTPFAQIDDISRDACIVVSYFRGSIGS